MEVLMLLNYFVLKHMYYFLVHYYYYSLLP